MEKANRQHIGRRAILKGAAITTAAGIMAAAALRATIAPAIAQAAPVAVLAQSEPLVALWDAWRKADRRLQRAYSRQDEAEGNASEAGFIIDVPIMTVGVYGCCHSSEVLKACRLNDPDGFTTERAAELVKVYRQREAHARRQRIAAGLRPYDTEAKAARAEWRRILHTIATTPATTVAGIAVKLRFIKKDTDAGPTVEAARMMRSALADATRLADKSAA